MRTRQRQRRNWADISLEIGTPIPSKISLGEEQEGGEERREEEGEEKREGEERRGEGTALGLALEVDGISRQRRERRKGMGGQRRRVSVPIGNLDEFDLASFQFIISSFFSFLLVRRHF